LQRIDIRGVASSALRHSSLSAAAGCPVVAACGGCVELGVVGCASDATGTERKPVTTATPRMFIPRRYARIERDCTGSLPGRTFRRETIAWDRSGQ
jgi:hypothetical protein